MEPAKMDLSVRPYQPGDEHALAEMAAGVLGGEWTMERWLWQFRHPPSGPARTRVLVAGDRPVGQASDIPFKAYVQGRALTTALGAYTMILPEFRGRFGFRRLLETPAYESIPLRISFPYDRAATLLRRYGTPDLGRIPRWTYWLGNEEGAATRPSRIARAAGLSLFSRIAAARPPRLAAEPLTELGPEVDALAHASGTFAPCIRVRDADYLRWRWSERPGLPFTIRGVRGPEGVLRGWIVFCAERTGRGRIGDVLATDAEALRALLADAVETLRGLGCSRIVFDYLDPRPWARRAVLRAGFLPRRGPNVMVSLLAEGSESAATRRDAWYLTAGDTDRI